MRRMLQVRSGPQGEVIDGVRRNEWLTALVFGGRRNRAYRDLVDLSRVAPGERVLDVGCGRGYLARRLVGSVGSAGAVVGIDPSARAVDLARRHAAPNCTFEVGTAQDLDFPDASFDVVTSTLAVHHIPAAERQQAFSEFRRVLRPGGRLLVADFGRQRTHAFSRHGTAHQGHHAASGPADLAALARRAGFELVTAGTVRRLSYVLGSGC